MINWLIFIGEKVSIRNKKFKNDDSKNGQVLNWIPRKVSSNYWSKIWMFWKKDLSADSLSMKITKSFKNLPKKDIRKTQEKMLLNTKNRDRDFLIWEKKGQIIVKKIC